VVRLRQPIFQEMFGLAAASVIRLWHSTLRVRTLSLDSTRHPWDPNRRPCVYAIWHDSIFAVLGARAKAVALISQHHDGELIARTAKWLGFATVRGSSTRGGAAALREIQQITQGRHLLITPDGPRGPRHKVKPGLIYAAQTLKRPIVLIGIGYDPYWQIDSWDRSCLPKPFGKIYAVFSEPINIHPLASPSSMSDWCCRIENRFIQISNIAWHWSRTRQRPVPGVVRFLSCSPITVGTNQDGKTG